MTAPISRREVLAFIALADAPIPDEIQFDYPSDGSLNIETSLFDTAETWRTMFGVDFHGGNLVTIVKLDNRRPYQTSTSYADDWRGWRIRLNVTQLMAEAEPALDEDTAAALREIAGGES